MKKFTLWLVFLFAIPLVQAQTIYNINETGFESTAELTPAQRSSDPYFSDALRARPFVLNPQLQNPQTLLMADQVVLQLFDNVNHQATVIYKETDFNGVTGVTLRLNQFDHGYAYLSISGQGFLLTVHLPEVNQSYSSRSAVNNFEGFLFELDPGNPDTTGCGLTDNGHQSGQGNGIDFGLPGNNMQNESCITMPDINDPATINLMIVYTPEADAWASNFGGGMNNVLNNTMTQLNQVSVNNNLGITFDLVFSNQVNYTEVSAGTDLNNLATPNNGQMDEVHDWRVTYEADLVALLSYIDGDGIGGIARLLTSRYGNLQTGFSNTKVFAATSLTFAHELGHNMGAMHNLNQASDPGPTVWTDWPENTWSAGWRWQGTDTNYYADLMSYTGLGEYPDGNPTSRIPYFSDPTHTHMGAAAGHPDLADNARTLKEVKHFIARYRLSTPFCNAGVSSPPALYISELILGDINHSSSFSVYSDYSSFANCMQAGDTETFTITAPNGISSSRVKIWVDWNNDNEFDEQNELEYASTSGGTTFTGSFSAPLGVASGTKRMRVRLYDISSGTQNTSPCGTATFGEVEDYTINLEASVPCTEAGIPQNLTFDSATNSTATLSWDPLYGIDFYELRYRETGAGDWQTVSPIWYPNHTITGLTFETEYEAQVRSVCDGTPGSYTSSLVFETAGYCASQGGNNWNITNVTFSDINNNSSAGNPSDSYTDFTNISANVSQLFSYDLSITGTGLPDNIKSYRVWIDYNQNGEFEMGELVLDQQTNSFTATVNVTIPQNALIGTTRMRVSYTAQLMSQGPCATFGFGEVEDYTVDILEFTPCETALVPENFALLALSDTAATLGWDTQSGAAFELRFRESGDPDWTEPAATFNNELVLGSLNPATTYEAQVRSKCDENTYSDYTSLLVFETYNTPPAYCAAGATNTSFEKISNVTFNTISNNSTSTGGYEDFTHLSTAVEKGESYAFSASFTGQSYNTDQVLVWIDFNQNGDFTDPGEEVLVTAQGTSPWLGTISIDSNALNGPTRMRVRLHDASEGPNTTPCGNSTYGQVEDYTLVINPSGFVFQNGSWSPEQPSGISTETDDIHILNGSVTLSGNVEANNLFISSGAILINGHVLSLSGDINNDGLLLFSSSASTTGQLNLFNGNHSGSGQVTIERYIPARRAFRLLSSAVTTNSPIRDHWQEGTNNPNTSTNNNPNPGYGTHITGSVSGANGFDATPSGNPSLFTLNNATQSWVAATDTDVTTIQAGKGYRLMVRGDRSIDVTSNSASPTNTTLRSTGSLFTGTYAATDFNENAGATNFFGNPYPAAVDMNEVLATATNVNPSFYYIWDPTMATRGAYISVDLPTGTNAGGSDANQYLQSGQAAFVSTLANGPVVFSIQESHKAVDQPQTQVFDVSPKMDIRLYTTSAFAHGENASDAVRIKFDTNASNAVTPMDAPKFFNLDENLAANNNGNLLSIESRALPLEGESIPLFNNQYRTTDYLFEARLTEVNNISALLKDHFTGTVTTLENNQITYYAFQVDTAVAGSIAEDRFEIIFEELILSNSDPVFGKNFVLYPNPTDGAFKIATHHLEGEAVTVSVNSITGQEIYSANHIVPSDGLLKVHIPELASGMYIVNLLHKEGGTFTAKLIKN